MNWRIRAIRDWSILTELRRVVILAIASCSSVVSIMDVSPSGSTSVLFEDGGASLDLPFEVSGLMDEGGSEGKEDSGIAAALPAPLAT